ncbi:hypothetical protein AFE_1139 [Acidithiobacillus ferrooxidans ATCC 23270]|uniref:Uncharacterized protein n=1 Tax=Acidithiobacillus ferrooxidans (strain ATCC 23270 / DSM 14882 / CIP 104768 / NCIMB 8455) TaxID=243159 RepID=B7J888_ACIF2|nr:hypothetical protein AFE_1139 [Acidithiobacillus ferrooxidans ATCC 23270]
MVGVPHDTHDVSSSLTQWMGQFRMSPCNYFGFLVLYVSWVQAFIGFFSPPGSSRNNIL